MKPPHWLQKIILTGVDAIMAAQPQKRPSLERLRSCKLVAHRGAALEGVRENTLEAFENAVRDGAWGLEFDLRWTKDDLPLVHHDPTTLRVWGEELVIADMNARDLTSRLGDIPLFETFLNQFKGRAHFMIEVKREREPLSRRRLETLASILKNLSLEPIRDFHFLGLTPETLLSCDFVPRNALFAVAEINLPTMSRFALENGLAGVSGQYVLVNDRYVEEHHARGQKIGTGFISSRNVLYREINRGVDWIFTNHVRDVARFLNEDEPS